MAEAHLAVDAAMRAQRLACEVARVLIDTQAKGIQGVERFAALQKVIDAALREEREAGWREGIATAIQYHKGQVENERRRRETARDFCDDAAETVADHHIIAHFNSATALRALAQEDQDV